MLDYVCFNQHHKPSLDMQKEIIEMYYELDMCQVPFLVAAFELEPNYVPDRINLNHFDTHFLKENMVISVLKVQGVIAGFTWFTDTPNFSHIHSFYICPEFRRKGYGTILMKHTVSLLQNDVSLDAIPTNEPARAFYRSLGFYDSCVTMTRRL